MNWSLRTFLRHSSNASNVTLDISVSFNVRQRGQYRDFLPRPDEVNITIINHFTYLRMTAHVYGLTAHVHRLYSIHILLNGSIWLSAFGRKSLVSQNILRLISHRIAPHSVVREQWTTRLSPVISVLQYGIL